MATVFQQLLNQTQVLHQFRYRPNRGHCCPFLSIQSQLEQQGNYQPLDQKLPS